MGKAKYSIVSVDWKPEQTPIWLHHVEKHCPNADITLIPDEKPIPWCWSGGKINCFKQIFATNRIIYMDTDVIVTRDLEFVFDEMGDALFGASSKIPRRPFGKRREITSKLKHLGEVPPHYSSGMIAMNMERPDLFAGAWEGLCHALHQHIGPDHYMEEIALSYLIRDINVWDMPLEVHGNICGGKHFGDTDTPAVIHYHQPRRLEQAGLGKWLNLS